MLVRISKDPTAVPLTIWIKLMLFMNENGIQLHESHDRTENIDFLSNHKV